MEFNLKYKQGEPVFFIEDNEICSDVVVGYTIESVNRSELSPFSDNMGIGFISSEFECSWYDGYIISYYLNKKERKRYRESELYCTKEELIQRKLVRELTPRKRPDARKKHK